MGKIRDDVFILGITGGVGTGKSTVSKILESRGFFRINADELALRFTDKDSPIRREIQELFGDDSFPPGMQANRALIAKLAFGDPDKKKALEALIHPRVRKDFLDKIRDLPPNSWVAWEVPLLFETEGEKIADSTVCVYLPVDKSWDRVSRRGGMPREDFEKRVRLQMDIEKKKSLSDFVIHNDNSIEDLEKNVDGLIEKLRGNYSL